MHNMRCSTLLWKETCRNYQIVQINFDGKIAKYIIIEILRPICTVKCRQEPISMGLTARLIFKMFRVGI